MRIAHLSSAHPRDDVRIFNKQCRTLARAGHRVSLIIADGQGDEVRDEVAIIDVGVKQIGRWRRMTDTVRRVYQCALALKPDVVHFHDPELLLAALRLKKARIKVVYDVHEDLPRQILAKHWIPSGLRPVIAGSLEALEQYAVRYFDAVVTSTPYIRQRFVRQNADVIDVCNYPILQEFVSDIPWQQRHNEVCYVGSLSRTRGIEQLLAALPDTDATLNLAGRWSEGDLRERLVWQPGWAQVNDLGILDRAGVAEVLARSKVGLVTLLPTPSYVNALPIKLFEYMAAGLPVIASDFPLWRGIVEEAGCGVLVDPENPSAIAEAIRGLLGHDARAAELGRAGQQAVTQRYSWTAEAEKLIQLYQRLEQPRR